ncbi:hypothetical protein LZ30DRAFT_61618 [Colletotrichum cereale]|nr:hypothetical protein LZ30DRAFT_61618 [Colletotrichum cereale]
MNRASERCALRLLTFTGIVALFGLLLSVRLQKVASPSDPSANLLPFPFLSHHHYFILGTKFSQNRLRGQQPCVKSPFPSRLAFQPATIHSTPLPTSLPTQFNSSVQPSQVDLNFITAFSSGFPPSATIQPQDLPVFTTDSQSQWLPPSLSSLPALPAHQQQSSPPEQPQQDFVLFDQPHTNQPRHLAAQTASSQRRHSSHHLRQHQAQGRVQPHQNHRVARIQASGSRRYPRLSAVYSPAQPAQFYASSAPSSSAALNHRQRPPVPLFSQNSEEQATPKMDLQGMLHLQLVLPPSHCSPILDLDLDDFTGFEGGASTTYSSPAMPSVFDLGGSTSGTSNLGTVSPQDLLIQEPFMSAPNSTAFTALTSPSIYNESPDFNDNYDVSPNFGTGDFGTGDFDSGSGDAWFPLFPQESASTSQDVVADKQQQQQRQVEQSLATNADDLEVVEFSTNPGHRKSANSSPSGSARHSSVSGVNSRRRDKPLPPIIVEDPNDTIAMKRARNTLAARKSRERKAQRFEDLEEKIRKLEEERDHWKSIAMGHS